MHQEGVLLKNYQNMLWTLSNDCQNELTFKFIQCPKGLNFAMFSIVH